MAVVPASMAESIIILDDDEEESPAPSFSASDASSQRKANHVRPASAKEPVPTHIAQSPFASAKKDSHVLLAENQRLFTEFVEYCTALTQDCPEVLAFLHAKHAKASPEFLSSVEFRNTVGRCLTRAQANRSKAFVYINELCTVLRQHSARRRQVLVKVSAGSAPASPMPFSAPPLKSKDGASGEENGVTETREDEQPSTSGLQEDRREANGTEEQEKKEKRASRKQIAYLENLLKVYNDEIRHLQEKEMSLDDLEAEDSGYIQEHKLKRKMMKIYDKLCELKGCNTLTGRVIEQRLVYNGTRYPEINKKIERFINSPEAQRNPPDYPDILQHVLRANERYKLCLSRKQINQIAQEAFRDTGSRLQERRHLDLVFNFGSHLTDRYKSTADPALSDPSLLRKLRTNREVAMSSLEEVITKYAIKQDDTEEQERSKRREKEKVEKEKDKHNSEVEEGPKEEGREEDDEDDEDDDGEDDDVSSDPDIEEEIQASSLQAGPEDEDDDEDDEEEEEEDGDKGNNEAEQACAPGNKGERDVGLPGAVSEEEDVDEEAKEAEPVANGLSPLSDDNVPLVSPLEDDPSPRDSPSQSQSPELNSGLAVKEESAKEESADSSVHVPAAVPVSAGNLSPAAASSPVAADKVSLPPSPVEVLASRDSSTATCDALSANGRRSPPALRSAKSQKRKREEMTAGESLDNGRTVIIISERDVDITLDMGVVSSSPPLQPWYPRADTPTQDVVTSSQYTPPPKKNKVNVSTQCDPDEIIILSDSE